LARLALGQRLGEFIRNRDDYDHGDLSESQKSLFWRSEFLFLVLPQSMPPVSRLPVASGPGGLTHGGGDQTSSLVPDSAKM
jgi:hypothetical protein